MALEADDVNMTALFILIAIVVVLLASIPFGVDSRETEKRHHRPNWS
jgi:hypothetical protein